ncbi:MAG TPA: hypothetical protein VFU02_25280 [Polyangiaceae bacterium]|nr:hypothetical protein [Polyangiaceae bacterium]
MAEPVAHDRATAQELIDDMIRTATLDALSADSPRFAPVRTQHGTPPQRLELEVCVRFAGAGGSGVLALACSKDAAAQLMRRSDGSPGAWLTERVAALGRRIQKRFRQFGIAVAFDSPEVLSAAGLACAAEAGLRSTYVFGPRDGDLLVHLEGELDVARIASAGEVPLRDEGDIILF